MRKRVDKAGFAAWLSAVDRFIGEMLGGRTHKQVSGMDDIDYYHVFRLGLTPKAAANLAVKRAISVHSI